MSYSQYIGPPDRPRWPNRLPEPEMTFENFLKGELNGGTINDTVSVILDGLKHLSNRLNHMFVYMDRKINAVSVAVSSPEFVFGPVVLKHGTKCAGCNLPIGNCVDEESYGYSDNEGQLCFKCYKCHTGSD